MVLFEYFAHDAVGTGWLWHAGTSGNLCLEALGTTSRTLESHCAVTVLEALANRVFIIIRET